MPATIIKPENWKIVSPAERGAGGKAKLWGQHIHEANPHVILLEEPPNTYTPVHHHTEPEVIIILEGSMTFNGEMCGPGTMILLAANEDYWHTTGDERCVVGLIRPTVRGEVHHTKETVVS